MTSRRNTNALRLLMAAFAVALLFQFHDRIPLGALGSDASMSAAVDGMIGRATYVQRQVAKALDAAEAAGTPGIESLEPIQVQLTEAAKHLTTAFNLMQSVGASTQTEGLYYARLREQSQLADRLNKLLVESGSAVPQTEASAEE